MEWVILLLLVLILINVKAASDNASSCWIVLCDIKQSLDILATKVPQWDQAEATMDSVQQASEKLEEIRYHLQEGKFIPGKQYKDD